jgi:hypothetical protein
VRRSMPWADAASEGLMFVAFGHSFDAFEAQLRRWYCRWAVFVVPCGERKLFLVPTRIALRATRPHERRALSE